MSRATNSDDATSSGLTMSDVRAERDGSASVVGDVGRRALEPGVPSPAAEPPSPGDDLARS